MARNFPSAVATALDDDIVYCFWACDLLFDAPNALYFWNGLGDLLLDGNTYTGAGDLLSISELRESSDIAAYGATLTLSGIPTNLVNLALSEPYQGRRATVKFGVDIGGVKTSTVVFTGEMDQMNVQLGPETVTISLDIESRLVDLQRARIRRYTDADQRLRFPNDLAFEFVTRLQNESLEWQSTSA